MLLPAWLGFTLALPCFNWATLDKLFFIPWLFPSGKQNAINCPYTAILSYPSHKHIHTHAHAHMISKQVCHTGRQNKYYWLLVQVTKFQTAEMSVWVLDQWIRGSLWNGCGPFWETSQKNLHQFLCYPVFRGPGDKMWQGHFLWERERPERLTVGD